MIKMAEHSQSNKSTDEEEVLNWKEEGDLGIFYRMLKKADDIKEVPQVEINVANLNDVGDSATTTTLDFILFSKVKFNLIFEDNEFFCLKTQFENLPAVHTDIEDAIDVLKEYLNAHNVYIKQIAKFFN